MASDLSFLIILPLLAHCSSSLLALSASKGHMGNNWAELSGAGDGPGVPRGSLMSWVGSSTWDWGLKGWEHPCYHGELGWGHSASHR